MTGELIRTASLMITAVMLLLLAQAADAESGAPQPIPGVGYGTSGNWIIESGDSISWEDATIILTGNLIIRSGGVLDLKNVEIQVNSSTDGQFGIFVESGGTLRFQNGVITSVNQNFHHKLEFDGSVLLESVSVSEVYGNPMDPWDYGVMIRSDDVSILNSTFYNCRGDVLQVVSSSPLISGNTIYQNAGAAVMCDGVSSPRILGNTVSRQDFGIISSFYASPVIDGNTIFEIKDNGIILNGFQRPVVSNNTIYDCLNGMLLWYSNAYIENNEIHHCDAGYNVKVESDATIVSDLIRGHEFVGISVNGSRLEVKDSTIQGSTYDGLRIFNNSRVKLVDTMVQNNGDDGFQITSAFTELWSSTVRDNKGDSLYLRDQAHADLRDSTISGNADGPGGNDGDWHLNIESGSRVNTYSSQFDRSAVHFESTLSKLVVSYLCEMLVMDESLSPVPDVGVDILNETGAKKSMGTDLDGEASRYLVLYEQSDLTGDGDGDDPGEKWTHSYDFTIDEDGYIPYAGTIDMDGDFYSEVILQLIPGISVVDHTPADGATRVPVETVIWISFDNGIVESSLNVEIFGQGGVPVSFQVFYHPENFTVELRPVVDLTEGVLYTVTIRDVAGIEGEIFREDLSFSFLTLELREPDHDEDGIPDRIDPDDDNDGFEDTVEELLGTDPFDSTDFPDTGDDDDTEPVDDDEPDPVDDDDVTTDDDEEPDDPVIIPDPPSDDDDQDPDGGIEPYIPVDRPEDMPDQEGDGSTWPLFIIGTLLGIVILAGVVLLIFIRGYGGEKLKDSGQERRDQG